MLKEKVGLINKSFSKNFKRIRCVGEVVLQEADNNDFKEYQIQIRVKFRDNEELTVLDRNRQSGGERAVSTILYLIAIQSVTDTPFRLVDEIN